MPAAKQLPGSLRELTLDVFPAFAPTPLRLGLGAADTAHTADAAGPQRPPEQPRLARVRILSSASSTYCADFEHKCYLRLGSSPSIHRVGLARRTGFVPHTLAWVRFVQSIIA